MSDKRWPLQWPAGKPRTSSRQYGRFRTRSRGHSDSYASTKYLTLAQAVKRLQDEIDRLGVRDAQLSSNVELRLDGQPRGGQGNPLDPGVCVYFTLKGKPHALPCDRYTTVEQNIAAIAAHIEATRAIERYGVADMGEMFNFAALPAPGQDTGRGWRTVMGYDEADRPGLQQVEVRFRELTARLHPDRGDGDHEAQIELNGARDQARRELTS